MLEKFYDLCYDLSDILLSLLIIAVIFFVVSWKISDSLELNTLDGMPSTIHSNANPETEFSENDDLTNKNNDYTNDVANNSQNEISTNNNPTNDDNTVVVDIPEVTNNPQTNSSNNYTPTVATGNKTFTINSGDTGSKIAEQLYKEGLIPSKSEFLSRLEERGLSSNLQIGTYTLSNNMSVDEIINKLARQ